jgi:hypothetical protein
VVKHFASNDGCSQSLTRFRRFRKFVHKLRESYADREACRDLWRQLGSEPLQIKNVGGPGHAQFGELLRHQEEKRGRHVQKSFGGLSKVDGSIPSAIASLGSVQRTPTIGSRDYKSDDE